MSYPRLNIKVSLVEPKSEKNRVACFFIDKLKEAESHAYLRLDEVVLFDLSRDEAFRSLSSLGKTSIDEWQSVVESINQVVVVNSINSTPSKMIISLILRIAIEVYPYLELSGVNFPVSELADDVEEFCEEGSLKKQFSSFLVKRYTGGTDYSPNGYETYFLDLHGLNKLRNKRGLEPKILFYALIELYKNSMLGMFEVFWGDDSIYSNYFVPIHLPTFDKSGLSDNAKKAWSLIQERAS